MNQYTYFVLGILLGIGLAVFYFMNREEKIEKQIEIDQKIYSTKILDITMENVVKNINEKIKELKRELTEEEKNEIIVQCYKEKFNIGKIVWLFKISCFYLGRKAEHIEFNSKLYLLDEPEVSLSPKNQVELAKKINEMSRYLGIQFIISTHSPFMLGILEAKIYNLDTTDYRVQKWSELENVRYFYDFFMSRKDEFDK